MDVTKVIERCKNDTFNFQAVMMFQLFKAINTIDNFKYDVINNKLIKWNKIVPTFSSMNKDSKLFFTLYADMQENCVDYNDEYQKTVDSYETATTIVPQGKLPENVLMYLVSRGFILSISLQIQKQWKAIL